MTLPKGFSRLQIRLHWIVAFLIVLQFVLHEPIVTAWRAVRQGDVLDFDPLVALHVFGGIAILALVVWRLVLRARHGAPLPPEGGPELARLASKLAHGALYLLMIAMPVSGAAAWFGGVTAAADVHEVMKPALLILVALHVVAALWHQFWLRDGLMLRMKRPLD